MAARYSVSVVISAIDRATAPIRNVQKAFDAFKKVEGVRRIGTALDGVKSQFDSVSREAGLLAARLGMLTAGGVGLFAAFLKPAAAMEQLRFRLRRLYGEARAPEMFRFIQDFAVRSPYGIEAITEALLVFKGQGFDRLRDFQGIMNYLAVYVPDQFRASNAIIQLSQAWGKAKLQMADIRPMFEAGIPVWELLQKVTGKTVEQLQEMSEKGTISRAVMLKMFQLMGKLSSGAGDEIFDLWSTKISNLEDLWTKFADRVMNMRIGDISVFTAIKADIDRISDFLNTGFEGETGQQVAKMLMDIYTTAKDLLSIVIPLASEFARLSKAFVDLVGPANAIRILLGLVAAPFVASLAGLIGSFVTLTTTVASWAASMDVAWGVLGMGIAVMELFSGPVGWIITAITAVAGLGGLIIANWNAVSAWFVAMWKKWGGLIRIVLPPLGALIDLADYIIQNWEPISDFFSRLFSVIWEIAKKVVSDLISLFRSLWNTMMLPIRALEWVSEKLPNMNVLTGRANFTRPALAMAPAMPVRAADRLMMAAMQPRKDQLELGLKVDVVSQTVQVTRTKSSGPTDLSYFYDLGFTQR